MTIEQRESVIEETERIVSNFFGNMFSAEEITESIINDVVEDIDETADWSSFEDDEICPDDVLIAVRRTLYNRITYID